MCGICGIIDAKGAFVSQEKIRLMADAMAHRGPDDSGFYLSPSSSPRAGLGHRRLSIIDLSSHGHQPMENEDGSLRIVLNGEIYNYCELRSELESKGHLFRSHTDTETVIHLYEEYGEDCVKFMRGMFAFAIWDENKKILFAARDRVGKKPFLYFNGSNVFIFASEFKSLCASGAVSAGINPISLNYYMALGYVPSPMTIYKDILKLPPAHSLILKAGKVSIKRYWELDYSKKIEISEEDAASEVIRLLREAVNIRLRSDVPLGAFLSGGIDSSAIVAMMSRESGSRIKTFSIGFEDKAFNELCYARAIASRFSTEHNEFIVKPDALKILPLLVERYGEPYADSSCIPTYYVCNETRKHVTVALNGDGGDELFAGYDRYQAICASDFYNKLPHPAKLLAKSFAVVLPDSTDFKNRFRRLKRFFDGIELPIEQRYMRWISIFNSEMRSVIYSESFKDIVGSSDPSEVIRPYLATIGNLDILDGVLSADTHTYLLHDLLVKVDIASMSNSLEARSPFLDHKLMEFAAKLPPGYKMKNLVKKYILKKALKGILPERNICRNKMGFGVPVGAWFRDELKNFLKDILFSQSSLSRGYFKPDEIKNLVLEHASGKKDHAFRLWSLLMLELWHKRFID
ncbi:MAG: asparagine synthase (glutamine-hydrolyzing) [Candidatus Omnitrophica bacterium]|nr:asparagine synthase (glutamine-hydrolyzing) [Candidatus Omnitrophota bacterium]